MVRAPISGLEVGWTAATGHDDLLLLDGEPTLALAVAVLDARAIGPGGTPVDAAALPVGDVDALVAELRREAVGDALVAEGRCASCGEPVDVHFSLADLLEHRRPRPTRLAEPAGEAGWWRLRRTGTAFRLPRAADVLAAASAGDLLAACAPGAAGAREARAVERAMEALGPVLQTTAQGTCPECRAPVEVTVDARALCLEELRFLAGGVLEDVHLLASAYHWPEGAILDLPSRRRARYAELVRAGRGVRTDAALEVADG